MMTTDNSPPDFPAGEFEAPGNYDTQEKQNLTNQLREAPTKIRAAVDGLSEEQLNTKYKNWSIRQIVHHVADSHMNAFIRFKWALTESSPLIKSYDETKWSEVADARETPIEPSLALLEGLHARWANLIEALTDEEMQSTFFHPESASDVMLQESLPSYVWHTEHHMAQIQWLRERMDS